MDWVFYALLAPTLYTASTFVDKYILEKKLKDYTPMPLYISLMGFVVGLFFWVLTGFPILDFRDTLLILSTGILTSFATVLYYKALFMEETSKINFLFQIMPIFSLILSWIFLGESLTYIQLLGFFLILLSGIFISIEKTNKNYRFSQAFFLILIVDFLWAISGILIKFAISIRSFSEMLSYESFGIGLGGIVLFIFAPKIRMAFLESITNIPKTTSLIIFLNESLFAFAKAVTFFAFSIGPVALVSVLEGTQAFFAIVYGLVLTFFFPKIFKEDISKKGLRKKILFFVVLFVGILLVSLN